MRTQSIPQTERAPKTRAQVREAFRRNGISISEWAREHGFTRSLVYEVLSDASLRPCKRGKSHRVAVLLGLKRGVIATHSDAVNAAPFQPPRRSAR